MKRLIAFSALGLILFPCLASDTPPPVLKNIVVSNGVKTVNFTPAPAIDAYTIRSGTNVASLTNDSAVVLNGTSFKVTNSQTMRFYSLAGTPKSSNDLLSVNLLNRIAYGPTPDELARLASIGPQAYIAEQLAPESVVNTFDDYVSAKVNTGTTPPQPGWQQALVTGNFSTTNFYLYLTSIGTTYVDDVELRLLINDIVTNIVDLGGGSFSTNVTTNVLVGTNLLVNGDFESPALTPPWLVAPNMAGSFIDTTFYHGGSHCLKVVATAPGSTSTNAIVQNFFSPRTPNTSSTNRCQLSYWYLASTNTSSIQMRLSKNGGAGTQATASDQAPTPEWVYVTASGVANNAPALYLYLNTAGTAYIDDLKLVAGAVPEAGANLVGNGNFESAFAPPWYATANFTNTTISTDYAHSGASSLKLVGTAAGGGSGNSVTQNVAIVNGSLYTVSFWYLPVAGQQLTVRISGSGVNAAPDATPSPGLIRRKLDRIGSVDSYTGLPGFQPYSTAGLSDLRAWFTLNAMGSKRQLIEVLLQFLDNHFVTQNAKSRDFTDGRYDNGTLEDAITTEWEYREITRWRNALLGANCTFLDLLKISAESPAMIVYLDTVGSKGSGTQVANENYARELFELFTMGVDNGYDQNDIIVMSRAWTGWTVDLVDPQNINNPFAPQTVRTGLYPGVGSTGVSNLVGIWSFVFNSGNHGTNRTPMLSVYNPASPATNPAATGPKVIPARFGAAFGAGSSYQLALPQNRTGTNGIQDGYDVINHLANLPFTMEFISVKLCRLFIHDDFVHGVYDYTDPNRSAEAELVRQCMTAWNTPGGDGRKGNMRAVLATIFASDLFRSHGGSLQKVKTPYEFVVSSVRALRAVQANGTYTSFSDGYSFSSPMSRMGGMSLFNRAEPDGWPESGPPWISAGTLDERVRFVQALLASGTGDDAGNCTTDPVALLKLKLSSGQWDNATSVVNFFLGIIYPGEGSANLDGYRQLGVTYLNTADTGAGATSLFSGLGNSSGNYDTRVRGMVAMLMGQARFQEQ